MLKISPLLPLYIERYFRIIDYLVSFDELARVEDFLNIVEAWPKERFSQERERIHKEGKIQRVKKYIEDMKDSIKRRNKPSYLKRAEEVIVRLALEEELDDALYMEQLEKL